MTTAIYYPRSACSLGDITNRFCPTAQSPENLGRRIQQANRGAGSLDSLFTPNKPVIIPDSDDRSVNVSAILSCSPEQQAALSSLSHYAGGGAVMGLAQLLLGRIIYSKVPLALCTICLRNDGNNS